MIHHYCMIHILLQINTVRSTLAFGSIQHLFVFLVFAVCLYIYFLNLLYVFVLCMFLSYVCVLCISCSALIYEGHCTNPLSSSAHSLALQIFA